MRRFVAAFFRHPFTLILPAIIIPLIVVFLVRSVASNYTSTAVVYVTKGPVNTADNPYATPAQNLQTSLADTIHNQDSFVVKVAYQTDMPKSYAKGTANVDDLMVTRIRAGLTITASGTHYVSIAYNDTDPRIAAQLVNVLLPTYQDEYLQLIQSQTQQLVEFYRNQLQSDQQTLQTDSTNEQSWEAQHPGSTPDTDTQLAQYKQAVKTDFDNIANDQTQIQKLTDRNTLLQDIATATVTDPGKIPSSPTVKSKTTITAMIGGVALGLGVSLGLIGLLALSDRRIHSRDDLTDVVPLPVLEVLPHLRGLRDDELVVGSEENLLQLAHVPVLATLPRFAESTQTTSRPLKNRAEEE